MVRYFVNLDSTNDIWAGRAGADIAADLHDLLTRLFTRWPDTRVLLSTLLYPRVQQNDHWKDYNAALPTLVAALRNQVQIQGWGLT